MWRKNAQICMNLMISHSLRCIAFRYVKQLRTTALLNALFTHDDVITTAQLMNNAKCCAPFFFFSKPFHTETLILNTLVLNFQRLVSCEIMSKEISEIKFFFAYKTELGSSNEWCSLLIDNGDIFYRRETKQKTKNIKKKYFSFEVNFVCKFSTTMGVSLHKQMGKTKSVSNWNEFDGIHFGILIQIICIRGHRKILITW